MKAQTIVYLTYNAMENYSYTQYVSGITIFSYVHSQSVNAWAKVTLFFLIYRSHVSAKTLIHGRMISSGTSNGIRLSDGNKT